MAVRDFCISVPAMPGSCFEFRRHKLDQHLMGRHKKEHRVHNNNKKKFSPPKSAKKRRQFEERRLAKLFEEEKENKSRLEYSYYCSAGDTDIYVEAVVKPIKGKAL